MTQQRTTNTTSRGTHVVLSILLLAPLVVPLLVFRETFFPFIFPKALTFQLLVEVALGIWLIYFRSWSVFSHRITQALTLFLGILIITTITSSDPLYSFWSTAERMTGVVFYLHIGVYFFLLASFFTEWFQWRRALWISLSVSVAVGMFGFGELVLDHALRMSSTLGNPIFLGTYALLHVFLAGIIFLSEKNLNFRVIALGLAVYNLGILLFSVSRGPLFALACSLVITSIIYAIHHTKKKSLFLIFGIGIVLLSGGLFYSIATNPTLAQKIPPYFSRIFSFAAQDRLFLWDIGWRGFSEQPLFGNGLNTFQYIFNRHFDPHTMGRVLTEPWYDHSHNQIIDILSDTGLSGMIAYLALWCALFVMLIRLIKSQSEHRIIAYPLLGFFIAFIIQNIFVFDHPTSLIFLSFGLALCVFLAHADRTLKTSPMHSLGILGIGVVTIIGTATLTLFPYMSALHGHWALQATGSTEALSHWRHAFIFDMYTQGQLTADLVRQLVETKNNSIKQNKELYEFAWNKNHEMVQSHPRDVRFSLIAAQLSLDKIHRMSSRLTDAERTTTRALTYAPFHKELLYKKVQFDISKKEYRAARDTLAVLDTYERVDTSRPHLFRALIALQQESHDEVFSHLSLARAQSTSIFSQVSFWISLSRRMSPTDTHFASLVTYIDEAVSLNPTDGDYRVMQLYLARKSRNDTKSKNLIDDLHSKDPVFAKKIDDMVNTLLATTP